MECKKFPLAICLATMLAAAAQAEQIAVKRLQFSRRSAMVARSEGGDIIARFEFVQTVQGNEVTMSLTYHFADGSIDDEMTTYRQQGMFRLVRDHHIQKGPFFNKPIDFAVDAATGTTTSRTTDSSGKAHVESRHMDLPADLANGFVGTLLLNVPSNTAPFRVGIMAPVEGGRLIHILISPDSEQPFQMAGKDLKAAVFRIHPELGGILGLIATLIGVHPKDVTVWVVEGDRPAVVRIVGQLGGYGSVVSSELVGASFRR